MTGSHPAVEVLDELAQAAFDAFYEVDRLPLAAHNLPHWRRVAAAVREAWRPYQNPTPDAFSAATRATRFHRQRAALLVDLCTKLLDRHPDEAAAENLALLRNDRVPTERDTP